MTSKTFLGGTPVLLTIALSAVAQGQPPVGQPVHTRVVFYAMGDVPYAPEEDVLLSRQVAELPQDAEFVIHVVDIKGGAAPCDEDLPALFGEP